MNLVASPMPSTAASQGQTVARLPMTADDFLTPEERLRAITAILAKGVLRAMEKQAQESREDRAFGNALAAEVASLLGAAT